VALAGFAGGGIGGVKSALGRIENHAQYAGLDDVFGIAALYAEAIACGHVFDDANKRTGLTCALAYLAEQGIDVTDDSVLEHATVALARREITREIFADLLSALTQPQTNNS
jgi:death on curing protein